MNQFKRPPIRYQGNKYRLLKKIVPLFPKKVGVLIDMFGGSSAVSLNVGDKAIYNEKNEKIFNLVKHCYINQQKIIELQEQYAKEYELMQDIKTEKGVELLKKNYNIFRAHVNSIERHSVEYYAGIYTLHTFSINGLIRFNSNGGFNASSSFKDQPSLNKLKGFIARENIEFHNKDFEEFIADILKNINREYALFYADPPYLNTLAVYNERGDFWTNEKNIRLLELLVSLDKKNYKFALSNTLVGKNGVENTWLKEWADKNNFNINYLNIKYNSFGVKNDKNVEVLITNYKVLDETQLSLDI